MAWISGAYSSVAKAADKLAAQIAKVSAKGADLFIVLRWGRTRVLGSVHADHHVGRLDDRVGLLAFRQLQLVDRLIGDRRRHQRAAADVDADMARGRPLGAVKDRSMNL